VQTRTVDVLMTRNANARAGTPCAAQPQPGAKMLDPKPPRAKARSAAGSGLPTPLLNAGPPFTDVEGPATAPLNPRVEAELRFNGKHPGKHTAEEIRASWWRSLLLSVGPVAVPPAHLSEDAPPPPRPVDPSERLAEVFNAVLNEFERQESPDDPAPMNVLIDAALFRIPPLSPSHPEALEVTTAICDLYDDENRPPLAKIAQSLSWWEKGALYGGDTKAWAELVARATGAPSPTLFRIKYGPKRGHAKPLIVGLLNEGGAGTFAGTAKTLKTTTAAEATAALITATPFLGLPVPAKKRVLYITGESIAEEIESRINRSLRFRFPNATQAELTAMREAAVFVTEWPDLIRKKELRKELTAFIRGEGFDVVFLDPQYRLLPTRAQGNLTTMGRALEWLIRPIEEVGSTAVSVHHLTKTMEIGAAPDLVDLSGAGCAEFCRSWLLLNRATPYAFNKRHDLLALHGTSSGDSGLLRVRVDEERGEFKATQANTSQPADEASPFEIRRGR